MSSKGTILVVEDNEAMNAAICDILSIHGYAVLSAENGVEALKILEANRPDLVLCDIMMPKMDGYTLLRHTRASAQLRTLPFIFLTARSSNEDRRQAKSIGIEDYLIKPVEPEDLTLAVNNAMRRSQHLAEEAQTQMDELRSQIVRTLQHEFRTPLTFILGYAEYLAEVSDEQIDLETLRLSTDAILEGGHRLQDMIEKFLLLSDIQFRQRLPTQFESIDPSQLLLSVSQTMKPEATKAGLSFNVDISGVDISGGSRRIEGDSKYLHRALFHLVENAIQYRQPSSTTIGLVLKNEETYIGLQVIDDGRGIPPEQLAQLNRPFEQLDRDDRTMPGAGLSLALIRHILRLHGGYLEIESEVGKGSTFTLWLPTPVAPSIVPSVTPSEDDFDFNATVDAEADVPG